MTPFSIAVLAFSMSADACAAAIGRGAAHRPKPLEAVRAGLVFGTVETITPLACWALGLAAAGLVAAVDHWIAFLLLGGVGGKMVYEAIRRHRDTETAEPPRSRGLVTLVATAIGTSIDAAAVGVTLAFLGADILLIALAIGFTTFVLATMGMLLGRVMGARFGAIVELCGGLGLIAIGTTILLDHTGMLG